MTTIKDRPFETDEDIAAITQFLLDTYRLYNGLHNWDPRRWQGTVYHRDDYDAYRQELPNLVHIWENAERDIIGVVIPEYAGSIFLHIHPDHTGIEADMLAWAEENLAAKDETGQPWIGVWSQDYDAHRNSLLQARGYTRTGEYENMYRRSMTIPISDIVIPDGYTVRPMRHHPDDQHGLTAMLNAAFKRDFHNAEEYRTFQSSPLYRCELDIVVEAPDGTLAATAGFTAHECESFALVEPVCTHPAHQGKRLARAAIAEGLRRIKALGIQTTHVGAWHSNAVANHVYQQMGFCDPVRQYVWHKQL